ncbi:hypothetical protein GCM10010885_12610 [Alicyclobacillus cellulosilyticus]|uniref:Sensory rhodopsin transducer n=1 Tax=Alicyclobacillus cellulosilyticus TaxID=1003997 RepID=A0A917NJC5_9BACL|nr:sensory rhodopsin transducer [Alicyclobacillus cellulosilyticus]GGJ04953.1 hypothetical protein GCM10010885_12610 [Alicyclobacillus cellulosilyticus]
MIGHRKWLIPDGYLPERSTGELVSHEAVCVLNVHDEDAAIRLTFYFEDREPMSGFVVPCGARRTRHIRLDQLRDDAGRGLPRGVPYAIVVESDVPVVVQHSRMDTSQPALALFTTMAYPAEA